MKAALLFIALLGATAVNGERCCTCDSKQLFKTHKVAIM